MSDIPIRDYIDKLREADQEAVRAALASAEKAVGVAETNAEKWRNSANEWRSAMGDRERNFLTRKEFYSIITTATVVIGLALAFKK